MITADLNGRSVLVTGGASGIGLAAATRFASCGAIVAINDRAGNPALIDREQGIPHMKGMPCSLVPLEAEEVARLEAEYGPTTELPHDPEGKVVRSKGEPDDFMYDEITGDGVEFEAVALSIYVRTSSM